jgi:hypothetical protein
VRKNFVARFDQGVHRAMDNDALKAAWLLVLRAIACRDVA